MFILINTITELKRVSAIR